MESTTKQIKPLERFWRLLKPDSREIRNIYVYSIFIGLVSLSLPLGIQAIVNLIQGGQINTAWIVLVVIVVGGVLAMGILQIAQMRITENLQQKIFTRASLEFAYRIPRIKMEALYKHYAPELMNRFFDVMNVQKGLPKLLIDITMATLQVVFGLILLSFYHPFFIALSLLLVGLGYVIFRLTAKVGLETSLKESKYKYEVAHWLEEVARTLKTFKLAGNTDLHVQKADRRSGDYLEARESHFKILIRQFSLLVIFKVVIVAGLLIIGGILVMEQQMNIGQFIAAEIIILLVLNSVEKLIISLETIYDVLTALEKIGQVTDMELETSEGIDLPIVGDSKGMQVELENVGFQYPESKNHALDQFSINIKNGEKITITGPNGSGKSTLLYILAGLYEIQRGSLTFNQLPIGNLNPFSLRTVIGDCFKEDMLFEGTVMENISMNRKSVTFEDVQEVVNHLNLQGFIKKLPKGYDSLIDPQGYKLPRSTVQKLLLARAIVHKPKLLLIEDVLKEIDGKDRLEIIQFLMRPENPWTVVAVSSDPEMAKLSDRIIIMDEGKIIQNGSFAELKNFPELKINRHA